MEVDEESNDDDMPEEEERIPRKISLRKYIASRIEEIGSLTNAIASTGSPSSKGLAFQHVPKHMRRRAVSHDTKRLPSRLRSHHLVQLEKSSNGIPPKPSKPSRKHRRRKKNLLSEYNRRQREVKWLETHIWHAKRFHMEKKWGHQIPIRPCDKGYRALYRSYRSYSTMRDESFHQFFLITSENDTICHHLKKFLAPDALLESSYYRQGRHEGTFHFYQENQFPYGYIGIVKLLFVQAKSLLLCIHPSISDIVLEQLVQALSLLKYPGKTVEVSDSVSNIDKRKYLQNTSLSQEWYWKSCDGDLLMRNLTLNCVSLIGERTFSVLKEVLLPSPMNGITKERAKANWYFSLEDETLQKIKSENDYWLNTSKASDCPCNYTFYLSVRDPRLETPIQRLKCQEASDDNVVCKSNPELENPSSAAEAVTSVLFSGILSEKISDSELAEKRSKLLISSQRLKLGQDENQVPVILIKSFLEDDKKIVKWTLILPSGWTLPFWLAFSYRAVRAAGLRDATHFELVKSFSKTSLTFPPDGPFDDGEETSRKDEYFRMPPAKRHNFIKLACPFPFKVCWSSFLTYSAEQFSSDKSQIQKFYVLRSKKDKALVQSLLSSSEKTEIIAKLRKQFNSLTAVLIPVAFVTKYKGTIDAGATISIPLPEDIDQLKFMDGKLKGSAVQLSEPSSTDCNQEKRSNLKVAHTKNLAFLRKKRKKIRNKIEANSGEALGFDPDIYDSKTLSECYNEQMNNLWLPSDPIETLKKLSRPVIGFVEFGYENYSVGRCSGVGYCSLIGMIQLNSKQVLIRNCRSSNIYRLASLEII